MAGKDFEFTRHGRSMRTALALMAVWMLILMALLVYDASLILVSIIGLLTIPAALDFALNPSAGLTLSEDRIGWHSGRRRGELAFSEIDHMRFDTRLDFSVRVSAVLNTPAGKKIRLPYESLPAHRRLEQEMTARGLTVKRHHFSLF